MIFNNYFYYLFCLVCVAVFYLIFRNFNQKKTGFYIVMGEFGSGKTQNTTKYLKFSHPKKEINITNYYTGYTHHQIQSTRDIINVLSDIYDYHQYINLYDDIERIYSFKKHLLPEYYEKAHAFREKYPYLVKDIAFNLVLDESSIYFNPRNFAENFSGKNEKLLEFIYQPRKLKLLFFCVVQSPLELDVKFRRLASYYRKYYKGFFFLRWNKDYYFENPEEMDFEKAEKVGWGININIYPVYPRYDYSTKELIRVGESIYLPGSIYKTIEKMGLKK